MKNKKNLVIIFVSLILFDVQSPRPVVPSRPASLPAKPAVPPRPASLLAQSGRPVKPEVPPRPARSTSLSNSFKEPSVANKPETTSFQNKDELIVQELKTINDSLRNGPLTKEAAQKVLDLNTRVGNSKVENREILDQWVSQAKVLLKRSESAPTATLKDVAPQKSTSTVVSNLASRAKKYKEADFNARGRNGTNSYKDGQFTKDLTKDLELSLNKKFSDPLSDKDAQYINNIKVKLDNYKKDYIDNQSFKTLITEAHRTIVTKAEERLKPLLERVEKFNNKRQEKLAKKEGDLRKKESEKLKRVQENAIKQQEKLAKKLEKVDKKIKEEERKVKITTESFNNKASSINAIRKENDTNKEIDKEVYKINNSNLKKLEKKEFNVEKARIKALNQKFKLQNRKAELERKLSINQPSGEQVKPSQIAEASV